MQLSELIIQLEILKKEHGDIPVYVWADQGQMCLTADDASMTYIDAFDEMVHPDDMDEHDIADLTKAIVLDG
jgi:hypothetical protein